MATEIQTSPSAEAEPQPRNLALASIRPANLLSFAPDTEELPLEPLNILIGANGSGKSNLLDAIGVLQAAALGELTDRVVVKGRGVVEWVWKGAGAEKTAKLEVVVPYLDGNPNHGSDSLRYQLEFEEGNKHELKVSDELLKEGNSAKQSSPARYIEHVNDLPVVRSFLRNKGPFIVFGKDEMRESFVDDYTGKESVLSIRWSADNYPEAAYVSRLFRSFYLYRDWIFGRNSKVRDLQRLGTLGNQLEEDASNLGLVLNNLKDEVVGDKFEGYLKEFLEDARRVSTKILGEHLQFGVSESGLKATTPAGRLSDGTLRWLALMAVLLHPIPPPLICLEEPESGLHPNIMPILAELLLDASQRTQIVVTTHSRGLVDRFTDTPEYVVTFDNEEGATKMRRLPSKGELRDWLDEYESLGPLWASGLIGGNRF